MVSIEIISTTGEIDRQYKGEPMALFNRYTALNQMAVNPKGLVALVTWSNEGDPHIEYFIGILT